MDVERQLVREARKGGVHTIALDRPKALNSLTKSMHKALLCNLDRAAEDRSVRCVILTGDNTSFCAGQDIGDIIETYKNDAQPDLGAILEAYYHPLIARLRTMPVPVIAAVRGVAAGAGVGIALMCDLVIASRTARFVFPFTKIGLVPDSGLSWLLPRVVGRAKAMGLMMLSSELSATEAERMGLIWRCVDDEEFSSTVNDAASRLENMSAAALFAARALVDASLEVPLAASLNMERQAQKLRGLSKDGKEGFFAFVERREPQLEER